MNKKDLLENIRDYSPKEIAAAINAGVVSFYELRSGTHGQFTPLLQRQVKAILETGEEPESVQQPDPEPFHSAVPEPVRPPESEPFRPAVPDPVQQPEQKRFHPAVQKPVRQPEPEVSQEPVNNDHKVSQADQTLVENFTPVQVPNPTPIGSQARLIPCPECGKMVSPLASQCPSCGMPFTMVTCSECGSWVSSQATECPTCGMPLRHGQPVYQQPNQQGFHPANQANSMQEGRNAHLGTPPNINSFSWGGFVFNWIWGVCNGVYWSLVTIILGIASFFAPMLAADPEEGLMVSGLISIGSLIISIVLGVKGNRMAWKSKRFNSIDHFVTVQKGWRTAAFVVLGICVGIILFSVIVVIATL